MAQSERRTLGDFAMPDISSSFGGIVAPAIAKNNFEIKPSIIQMVQNNQFGGLQGEDPYAHILTFLNVCAIFKINGMTDDAIRLRLFPFLVKDKAQLWLASLPNELIITWDQFKRAFLTNTFHHIRQPSFAMRSLLSSKMEVRQSIQEGPFPIAFY